MKYLSSGFNIGIISERKMSKKNRLIMVIICTVLFLIITPCIVLYSLGYRVDLVNGKVIETGGIYVRVVPYGANITINSGVKNKTGFFSNSVFVQNLLPKKHSVLIEKEGYHGYQKELLVKEREVTKLENVILFKNNIAFDLMEKNIDYFSIAPNNNTLIKAKTTNQKIDFEITNLFNSQKENITLPVKNATILDSKWSNDSKIYLLKTNNDYFILNTSEQVPQFTKIKSLAGAEDINFNPENSNELFFIKNQKLYSTFQDVELIKDVAGFLIEGQKVVWLSYDGFLYSYDLTSIKNQDSKPIDSEKNKITKKIFPIKKNNQYKLISVSDMIFLQEDESLFLMNRESKIFEIFHNSFKNLKVSPDGQKIAFYDNYEIVYSIPSSINEKVPLKKFDNIIDEIYWLNNDYLVFKSGNEILISEIDARGNVNIINLSKINSFVNSKETVDLELQVQRVFFNEQDKKLYILTEDNFFVSEKLLP